LPHFSVSSAMSLPKSAGEPPSPMPSKLARRILNLESASAALASLLDQWPTVRRLVPDAQLLLAGRGLRNAPALPGVEVVGEVAQASDVLSRAAVLAFPCPPTSGPKMKVLDALAWGLPVVTTDAGTEGLSLSPGTITIASPPDFAAGLAAVLKDEPKRRRMAAAGRADVLAHHRPEQAAAARLALIDRLVTSHPQAPPAADR